MLNASPQEQLSDQNLHTTEKSNTVRLHGLTVSNLVNRIQKIQERMHDYPKTDPGLWVWAASKKDEDAKVINFRFEKINNID